MTKTTHTPLNPAATLRHTRDTRFKTARLSLVWVFPADAEASPLTTLLFGIYRRGSEKYPRLALLNRRLDELYGTTLTIRNYLYGDRVSRSHSSDEVSVMEVERRAEQFKSNGIVTVNMQV